MVVTTVAIRMMAMVSPAHKRNVSSSRMPVVGDEENASDGVPMPACPTIHDIRMKSITPQMFSMQRTCSKMAHDELRPGVAPSPVTRLCS